MQKNFRRCQICARYFRMNQKSVAVHGYTYGEIVVCDLA
jgi:hypothetical protein